MARIVDGATRSLVLGSSLVLGLSFSPGCANSSKSDDPFEMFRSSDVHDVQIVTRAAVADRNVEAIPYLIRNLRHEDEWMRFLTHAALIQIVLEVGGKTVKHGYQFQAPRREREKAVQAWEEWYEKEGKKLAAPASD